MGIGGLVMLVFSAEPGSSSHERLQLLADSVVSDNRPS